MIVRGPSLAATMSQYLRQEIAATPNIEVLPGHQIVGGGGQGRLERLTLESAPRARNGRWRRRRCSC